MVGVITSMDILTHPITTIQCFGWMVFMKALFVSRGKTFLSLLPAPSMRTPTEPSLSPLTVQCIDLELRVKRIYEDFAIAFADRAAAAEFFEDLADQEQQHAELLALCQASADRSGWRSDCGEFWEHDAASLEEQMRAVEERLHEPHALEDALRLVIQLESAEINRIFLGIMDSCRSAFVQEIAAFQRAMERHLAYIADRIPKLDPRLALAVAELRRPQPRLAQMAPG